MSQSRIPQIMRLKKSLPLKLPQNSMLKINASAPVNIHLQPEWRDDGHITLEQTFRDNRVKKLDWNVRIVDGKKEGLTSVDVSIQSSSKETGEASLEGAHAEEELEMDKDPQNHIDEVPTFIAKIPEKCNVNCALSEGGDILVNKKLEGEFGFEFLTSGGDIVLEKIRGDKIQLDSKFQSKDTTIGGTIHIKKACDAQDLDVVVNKGGRLRAKLLNVSDATIEAEDIGTSFESIDDDDACAIIDLSSVYTAYSGEGAHLEVKKTNDLCENEKNLDSLKKVRVKSSHGHLSVRTSSSFLPQDSPVIDEYGQKIALVELGGVNGSFDVSVDKFGGNIISNDTDLSVMPTTASVHVDSLSPGQASIITSDFGSIGISLDRKIESDIRLLSTSLLNNMDTNSLLSEDENELIQSIADHDDDIEGLMQTLQKDGDNCEQINRISIETEAFAGHRNVDMKHSEYVHGTFANKSQEPDSRFDVKTKGSLSSVGKIRIEDAAGQALQGFSGGKKEDGDESNNKGIDSPLLVVATDGQITVESLSWFGAIARRYGVKEDDRDLGRQAKASITKNEL